MHDTADPGLEPWASKVAFPFVLGAFYLTLGVTAFFLYLGWWWPLVPLVLLSSHLMHAMLIAFHEAAHGSLRKSKWLNDFDGVLVGTVSITPFTLYRALHQKHHINLASEKDVELWPFVDPRQPLWWRRMAAFLELNFGFFYSPYLFWRVFFQRPSPVTNPRVRRRIWWELALIVVFWGTVLGFVAYFQAWLWFLCLYFIPAFIAGNLQSWRKYIEHVGLKGHTGPSATRSIIADTVPGRFVSLTLLHQPFHGVHHVKSSIPHDELPAYAELILLGEKGDTVPFPNYRSAFADLIKCLHDPRVGRQWTSAS
jgi:fatty acid desaturase